MVTSTALSIPAMATTAHTPTTAPYQEHPDHFQSFQGSHYSDPRGRYHTEQQHSRYVPNNDHHDERPR